MCRHTLGLLIAVLVALAMPSVVEAQGDCDHCENGLPGTQICEEGFTIFSWGNCQSVWTRCDGGDSGSWCSFCQMWGDCNPTMTEAPDLTPAGTVRTWGFENPQSVDSPCRGYILEIPDLSLNAILTL